MKACFLELNGSTTLWINSYFPTDPQLANFDDAELMEVLAAIKNTIETNQHDYVILQGDINSDFRRTSKFVELV